MHIPVLAHIFRDTTLSLICPVIVYVPLTCDVFYIQQAMKDRLTSKVKDQPTFKLHRVKCMRAGSTIGVVAVAAAIISVLLIEGISSVNLSDASIAELPWQQQKQNRILGHFRTPSGMCSGASSGGQGKHARRRARVQHWNDMGQEGDRDASTVRGPELAAALHPGAVGGQEFPPLERSTLLFMHVFKCAGSTLR